jgi:hypothetical protein
MASSTGLYLPENPPTPPPEPDIVHQLAVEAIRDKLIAAKEQASGRSRRSRALAEIKLFIRSDDDPRYLSWKSFDPIKVANGGFIFDWTGAPCVSTTRSSG